MTVYLSGPMLGQGYYGYMSFWQVSKFIREALPDCVILNPHEMNTGVALDAETLAPFSDWGGYPSWFDKKGLLELKDKALRECDMVVMLPYWEDGKDSMVEKALADQLGKTVRYAILDAERVWGLCETAKWCGV